MRTAMGDRHFVEIVPAALAGERVDRFVSLLTDVSRREAVDLIADGAVTVAGEVPQKPSDRLLEGTEIVVTVPERSKALVPDPSLVVPVVHADDQVLVVDKPAHLVVHPGSGVVEGTMVHGLLASYPELASVGDAEVRPGIVHRLDKGTTGLLMVARTGDAHAHLSRQLADRTVLRRYTTLVWGEVGTAEGLIDAPLGRSPRQPTKQAVIADGRPARTRYEVDARFEDPAQTLLTCRLETGRTHQIRVHLEAIGHPVVGDDRYGRTGDDSGLGRPFLHASALGFEHPVSGAWLEFESPLPQDLSDLLRTIG